MESCSFFFYNRLYLLSWFAVVCTIILSTKLKNLESRVESIEKVETSQSIQDIRTEIRILRERVLLLEQ